MQIIFLFIMLAAAIAISAIVVKKGKEAQEKEKKMFEFLYAKKVNNEELLKLVKENINTYHTSFHFNKDGGVEVFFGSSRDEYTAKKEQSNE